MKATVAAMILLGAVASVARALPILVTCGSGGVVEVVQVPGNVNKFTVTANCASTFTGTAERVEGNPSDLIVRGTWLKNSEYGVEEFDTITFTEGPYELPSPAPAFAWHVLIGDMRLVTSLEYPTPAARLQVSGTLNGVADHPADTGWLGDDTDFNVRSPFPDVGVYTGPPWTRTATYSWFFTLDTGKSSAIDLANTGYNPFATPEPSTAVLLGIGLAGLVAWRRRHTG